MRVRRISAPPGRTRRSRETCAWRAAAASAGGVAPESSAISRSLETTRFALRSKQNENAALLDAAKLKGTAAVANLERPEYAEVKRQAPNLTSDAPCAVGICQAFVGVLNVR